MLQKIPKCDNLPAKDKAQSLCVFFSVGPALDWGAGGSLMLSHHQPQAPAKTLPQTDLEMSRTAERSQGFHDLWPHTPKLNTRNAESRNGKNQRCLTRGTQTSDPLGASKALLSPGEYTLRQCWGGPGKGLEDLHPQLQQLRLAIKAQEKGGVLRPLPKQSSSREREAWHGTALHQGRARSTLCRHPGYGMSPHAARAGYGGAEGG